MSRDKRPRTTHSGDSQFEASSYDMVATPSYLPHNGRKGEPCVQLYVTVLMLCFYACPRACMLVMCVSVFYMYASLHVCSCMCVLCLLCVCGFVCQRPVCVNVSLCAFWFVCACVRVVYFVCTSVESCNFPRFCVFALWDCVFCVVCMLASDACVFLPLR